MEFCAKNYFRKNLLNIELLNTPLDTLKLKNINVNVVTKSFIKIFSNLQMIYHSSSLMEQMTLPIALAIQAAETMNSFKFN